MNDCLSHDVLAEAVSWRRHLHARPELAFEERQTSDFVASKLAEFGFTVHRGLATTGVVGTLTRGTSRRSIAIRADMDALPLNEQSGLAHASSKPGVMHACGHDGHMAIALAAARVCAKLPDLDGTVHFIFQPAEESGGGARRMVEEGLFRLFPCDSVYALHNWPGLELGSVVARNGAMMAANAVFDISIQGRGCHGAMPHEGSDPILAACQLVSSLQSIVSRNVDPLQAAVVSVTQINAGATHNIIPDGCVVRGTTRWFDRGIGAYIEARMSEISRSIAAAFHCEAVIRYEHRYPATINDPAAADFVRTTANIAAPMLRFVERNPSMAAEDFAFMLEAIPGCYVWLGAGETTGHRLHSSTYDFNDELLPLGVALWVSVIRGSLASA
jgi:amidohydrolase